MSFYTVSTVPPDRLSDEEIRKEIDVLKAELATIENSLAAKKAWAVVDGKNDTTEYMEWVARSRDFRKKLLIRYPAVH